MHPNDNDASFIDSLLSPIEQAAIARNGPLRLCNFATVDRADYPQIRTLILRWHSRQARQLGFYTDRRSPKCEEITHNRSVSCHFYSDTDRSQYRFYGDAEVRLKGPLWQSHWDQLKPHAHRDYASKQAPGTIAPAEYLDTSAKTNFALLVVTYTGLDWLRLSRDGHVRRRIDWSQPDVRISELIP